MVLVFDRSGSMRGQISNAASFARQIVSQLDVEGGYAEVGVIEFSSNDVQLAPLSSSPSVIEAAIQNCIVSRLEPCRLRVLLPSPLLCVSAC